jgi:serine/threonine-protein kinase
LDGRADLYSVGILLYQALTGKVPFTNPNDFDVMVAQVSTPPRPPSLLNPGIAPELERVVLTALTKNPEKRYASAAEFRAALASVISVPAAPEPEPIEVPAPDCAPPQFLAELQAAPSNRRAFVAGLLTVAAVLIAAYYLLAH